MNAAEIEDKLSRARLRGGKQRNWYIQATCAASGEGLYEGLDWLSTHLAKTKGFFLFGFCTNSSWPARPPNAANMCWVMKFFFINQSFDNQAPVAAPSERLRNRLAAAHLYTFIS